MAGHIHTYMQTYVPAYVRTRIRIYGIHSLFNPLAACLAWMDEPPARLHIASDDCMRLLIRRRCYSF